MAMRKCKYCGNRYEPKFTSTEPCPNYECRLKHLEANKPKIKAASVKREKEKLTDWGKKLQYKVQEVVRLIDYGQPCLARQYVPKQTHAGHVISRAAGANMKYNLHNMFAQSAQSNHFQNDDGLMRDGVKREFGEDYLEFIFSLKQTPIIKRSNDEYEQLYRNACKVANRLKKQPKKLKNIERIEMRNQINIELGIYPKEYCIYF